MLKGNIETVKAMTWYRHKHNSESFSLRLTRALWISALSLSTDEVCVHETVKADGTFEAIIMFRNELRDLEDKLPFTICHVHQVFESNHVCICMNFLRNYLISLSLFAFYEYVNLFTFVSLIHAWGYSQW